MSEAFKPRGSHDWYDLYPRSKKQLAIVQTGATILMRSLAEAGFPDTESVRQWCYTVSLQLWRVYRKA